jgi:hypothetical protein
MLDIIAGGDRTGSPLAALLLSQGCETRLVAVRADSVVSLSGSLRHGEPVLPRDSTVLRAGDEALPLEDDPARAALATLLSQPETTTR